MHRKHPKNNVELFYCPGTGLVACFFFYMSQPGIITYKINSF